MPESLNRRDFLKAAAIAAGPAVISARGANDKINIGWIGVGTRGYAALDWLHTAAPNDVQITAICDTYQGYITRAQDRLKTTWGAPAKVYADYRELLADPTIDAVYIMTREHLHHETIEEGFDIVRAGYGEQICGNEGTIEVMNRQDMYFTPETFKGKAPAAVKAREPIHLNGKTDFNEGDGAINHFRNYIQSILGNEKPIAPPTVGQQAAISGHMATLSFKNQKKVMWDEAASKVHFV